MAEHSPLFIGLVRPPKLLGLPMMYAVTWMFGSALLFIWIQGWPVLVLALISYPLLWLAADWDAQFLDVIVTSLQETPPTQNRKHYGGGDSYAP
ncbi:MAG: VirB3 family type IV secretion system protein [Deltaproteobacteria bacterium]